MKKNNKTIIRKTRISKDVDKELCEVADYESRTISATIGIAIEKYISRYKKSK